MDRTSVIFGNPMPDSVIRKAEKSRKKFIRRFGDDSNKRYHLGMEQIDRIPGIPLLNLVAAGSPLILPKEPLIVGNIRMGFGHYRIAIAIASCAQALGRTPVWFDLASFESTGSKMIRYQNELYSVASRLSQKIRLFNKLFWEPLNSEGFRKLSYNAQDQKNSELLVPMFADLPADVPFVGTHVWPSQGAVHAGLTHVVNAIPDNWPMGLHLAEGAIHTVQTPFAFLGYKMLNGMAKQPLKPMPDGSIVRVGHYVDHELVSGIEKDCALRIERMHKGGPVRFLMTVGGAGAGSDLYIAMTKHLLPYVRSGRAGLVLNLGDHSALWDLFKKKIPGIEAGCTTIFNDFEGLWVAAADGSVFDGVTVICNDDIFEAVYSTNILMHGCDCLVTKPSELAFYPVPKLMMRHIGGHEVYGSIYAREMGDATFECETPPALCRMIDALISDRALLIAMNRRITELKRCGLYDGGYEVVRLAVGEHK